MGSSGGGGSTSGMTDFPAYMKTFHSSMLQGSGIDGIGADVIVMSVVDAFNTSVSGNSPYYNYTTLESDNVIDKAFMASGHSLNSYAKIFELLESYQNLNFDTLLASYDTGTSTATLLESISTALDDEIEINVLPKFKANLRSVGAVMSSAYVVGEALIWDSKVKAIAKERLNLENVALQNRESALKITLAYMDFKKGIVQTTTDIVKYYYALKTDLDDHYSSMQAKNLKWDLDQFQYMNNTLSSISGAALSQGTSDKAPSKVASAIGGALSGAAAGAMVAGPTGAAVGGVIGLAGGLM